VTRFCAVPGCGARVTTSRCKSHMVAQERTRPNYALRRWYRTPQWKALRARVMREQAYRCAVCGQVVAALEVDHIVKHDFDHRRFWDRAKLQAICRSCHGRKTREGE
jgi:5-methylcytosine-specific restriction protein A